MPDVVLRVQGLTKRYGNLIALDGVSFSVRGGEILGLIGPNGSGKTTLFECLGSVLPADAGAVHATAPRFYLPDGIAPWPSQTVRWALDFAIGFFGGAAAAREEIAARLALKPFLGARVGTLSKGQRKRFLLAIGLLAPHPILLADEPFDGLDLRQSREVAQTLRDVAANGRTLFLSIHQLTDAARVCDRFVLLSNGRVCGEGTGHQLADLAAARGVKRASDLEEVFLALT